MISVCVSLSESRHVYLGSQIICNIALYYLEAAHPRPRIYREIKLRHWQSCCIFGVLLCYILFVQRLWMAPASKGALLNIHYYYYYYYNCDQCFHSYFQLIQKSSVSTVAVLHAFKVRPDIGRETFYITTRWLNRGMSCTTRWQKTFHNNDLWNLVVFIKNSKTRVEVIIIINRNRL